MTDKQCRDRIVGVLSASMMPMEAEAECIAFLDRCLKECWHPAEELPPMHEEIYEDFDETVKYRISDPLLIITEDGEAACLRTVAAQEEGAKWQKESPVTLTLP